MTRPTYDIHVDGVDASDLPIAVLRDLCDILLEGAQRAARLAFEGRSTGRGPSLARVQARGIAAEPGLLASALRWRSQVPTEVQLPRPADHCYARADVEERTQGRGAGQST